MRPRRVVAVALQVAALLIAVYMAPFVWHLVRAYLTSSSLDDQSSYVGTVLSAIPLMIILLQYAFKIGKAPSQATLLDTLRTETQDDVIRRIDDARVAQEIDLTLVDNASARTIALSTLVERTAGQRGTRLVLVGPPGSGKSYTCMRVAASTVAGTSTTIPVLAPLSQWDNFESVESWLVDILQTQLNISGRTAAKLVQSGRVLPVFDGLDELESTEDGEEPARRFLELLLAWQTVDVAPGFVLSTRDTTWARLPDGQRRHPTLTVYRLDALSAADASHFLTTALGSSAVDDTASRLVARLGEAGLQDSYRRPLELSLLARTAADGKAASHEAVDLDRVVADVANGGLLHMFVARLLAEESHAWRRLLLRLNLWRLMGYARYLKQNAAHRARLDGRPLEQQDLSLHHLWPLAGRYRAKAVDAMMAAGLSLPGLFLAGAYAWPRGILWRLAFGLFTVVWLAMLVRTTTKSWVTPALPDWSRLLQPLFVARQAGVSALFGLFLGLLIQPWFGFLAFVTAWLAIGLTVGFGQTLATDTQARLVGPEGVLRRERLVSRLSAWVLFPVVALTTFAIWPSPWAVPAAAAYCLVVGETVASALWRRYLALCIASPLRVPLLPGRTFRRMCELGLLRSAGRSYQFRHASLLDHFAEQSDPSLHLAGGTPWELR